MPASYRECEGVGVPGGAGRAAGTQGPLHSGLGSCPSQSQQGWGTPQDLGGWGCTGTDSSVPAAFLLSPGCSGLWGNRVKVG